jgi:hypothetical protein
MVNIKDIVQRITSYRAQKIVSPADSGRLASTELSIAARICEESVASVKARSQYIKENSLDERFALPDANWSYDAPNEFQKLFLRVSRCEKADIENLRAFCQVFSGYNLYAVKTGKGIVSSTQSINKKTSPMVAKRIELDGKPFVDEWSTMVHGLPVRYVFQPPKLFGECGYLVNGVIVNNDTNTYQERINLIYGSGLGQWIEDKLSTQEGLRICEIGGGYGALAYWFKKAFPNCSYTICDLPESLLFSRLYLTLSISQGTFGYGLQPVDGGVRFLPNYQMEQLDEPFDLVINTLSFSEMSEYQVRTYADLIKKRLLSRGGLFFEQNQDNRYMGLLCAQEIFSEYFAERVVLTDNTIQYRNGTANVWGNSRITLESKVVNSRPNQVRLLEDLGSFNLVQIGDRYFCLRKSLGPTDVTKLAAEDVPPNIFFGHSREVVVQAIQGLS